MSSLFHTHQKGGSPPRRASASVLYFFNIDWSNLPVALLALVGRTWFLKPSNSDMIAWNNRNSFLVVVAVAFFSGHGGKFRTDKISQAALMWSPITCNLGCRFLFVGRADEFSGMCVAVSASLRPPAVNCFLSWNRFAENARKDKLAILQGKCANSNVVFYSFLYCDVFNGKDVPVVGSDGQTYHVFEDISMVEHKTLRGQLLRPDTIPILLTISKVVLVIFPTAQCLAALRCSNSHGI